MRIAMFSWESLHSISIGGIAAHVTELAAALERRGHEVHVFTRAGPQGQAKHEVVHGVHYHRCPVPHSNNFLHFVNEMCNSFMWHLAETEAFQNAPFDVVHAHDWMCVKALVQAKNTHQRRTILTMHSTEPGRSGGSKDVCSIEWEGTFVADKVICVSGQLCDEVKWLYRVPDSKVRCVYNGINCHRFDGFLDCGEIKRSQFHAAPLDPVILFVGRMFAQKGPDLLMEAIPEVLGAQHNAKFVFIGDGDMRQALEQRSHQLGVNHACRFLGPKSTDELPTYYKAADLVVVPSRNEPFGLIVLEAWSAGKPVVATNRVGCPVNHNEDGYVVDCSPSGLAWGVKEICRNFEHARWMGSRGRAKAAFSFSWDEIAKQTEGVYEELQ